MITNVLQIWCDVEACKANHQGYPGRCIGAADLESLELRTVDEAVAIEHWTTKDGEHYCPKHKAAA